jgi:ATP-dependent RNA helicase DDX23/PRP28
MPTDSELSTIRARYLGQKVDNKKPRLRKQNDKRFIFDWKAEDDTTGDQRIIVDPAIIARRPGGPAVVTPDHSRDGTPGSVEQYADALEKRRAGRGNNDERHWSDKPLEDMKERDWRIFREDFSIAARGGKIPFPLRSWRESAIPTKILDIIDEIGYTEPSPIQRQAIPIGMKNRDLIGIAKTGMFTVSHLRCPMTMF